MGLPLGEHPSLQGVHAEQTARVTRVSERGKSHHPILQGEPAGFTRYVREVLSRHDYRNPK
jgi:hypothetical protein